MKRKTNYLIFLLFQLVLGFIIIIFLKDSSDHIKNILLYIVGCLLPLNLLKEINEYKRVKTDLSFGLAQSEIRKRINKFLRRDFLISIILFLLFLLMHSLVNSFNTNIYILLTSIVILLTCGFTYSIIINIYLSFKLR
ncbi:MAG: hypothetical protein IJS58_00775 [Bacilli bacterium]|nr:hypothetical protein [Bacilli bacterium]